MEHSIGTQLPLYSSIPFVFMLLSIALGPIVFPKIWHHHFPKISILWAIIAAVPLLIVYRGAGLYELLHILIADYIPFIALLWALYTVGGGILVRTTLKGTPLVNAGFLVVGAALASWMGTTGAAMLLIRPFLRINKHRKNKAFMVVFFIFLVANVGGSLTPLGDPPLFLGFLHSVPFFWTFNLFKPMLVVAIILLAIYIALDNYHLRKEQNAGDILPMGDATPTGTISGRVIELAGAYNFIFLVGIVVSILLSGTLHLGEINILGVHRNWQDVLQVVLLVLMGVLSLKFTPKELRKENEFTWAPIEEVAYLFFGIFITMAPVLAILKAGNDGALGFITAAVQQPVQYFWITGALSSFLDNAPTYLTFFSTALGQFYPGMEESAAVAKLLVEYPLYLLAISSGAVFFGAMTYIGNAPNFMVRSIAEEAGVTMPSFFGYIVKYSLVFLVPTFVIVTLLFYL
ncbi:MAG: sodium:proton antiporter [Firmicutes bacterium HGW-Firmicutes-12]|nr:MAG: sodium:proton antiporter [Firmicutes bacterium HGW-Firmicutes-12]